MGYLNLAGLSRFLGKITERLNGKVSIHQGDENEDCYLAVDGNGDLALRDVPITLGIPAEWDRLGFVRINDANATQDVFTVRFEEEGAEFEPDCTYAGSAHLYGAGVEYVSDIDLAMYDSDVKIIQCAYYLNILLKNVCNCSDNQIGLQLARMGYSANCRR